MAVATSSVNAASRASVSAGSGCSPTDEATMTPQSRPSTLIGTPTDEWRPHCRTMSATDPEVSP
jgi:hypothetical protein